MPAFWNTKWEFLRALLRRVQASNGAQVVRRAQRRWAGVDGGHRAAAIAYYLLLSLFPMGILLVTTASLFVEREVAAGELVRLVNRYTPLTREQDLAAAHTIRGLFDSRGGLNLTAIALLIWGGLNFLRAFIRTSNRIWQSQTYTWWRLPIKSLALLGVTGTGVFLGMLLPGLVRVFRQWLTSNFEVPPRMFDPVSAFVPWIVLFCGLMMMYKLAPRRPTKFSEVWIGAGAATILIWAGKVLFLAYLVHVARFNVLYGALGGILAFLLWIYFSSCACVLGVCFCAARAELREQPGKNESSES